MDYVFTLSNAVIVKDQLIMAALVESGCSDCTLVKNQAGELLCIFYNSPELQNAMKQICDHSLSLDVYELWEALEETKIAQSEKWIHESND